MQKRRNTGSSSFSFKHVDILYKCVYMRDRIRACGRKKDVLRDEAVVDAREMRMYRMLPLNYDAVTRGRDAACLSLRAALSK